MKRTDRDVMLAPLSDNILDKTIGFRAADSYSKIDSASSFIKQRLSKRDGASVTQDIKWPFIWAKEQLSSKKKVKKRGCKKVRLSAGQKKLLGLNKIGRRSLNFIDFTPIHQCWIQYMMDYFKIPDLEEKGLDGVEHVSWDEFSVQLWKADLHGAFVKVIRSTCPVFVGLEGYIIFESKNTYKVLGKTRGVPTELPENRIAYEEEYQSLVDSIIMSVRDLVTCEVLKGDFKCKEPYRVKERLDKYVGWSSGTLATLRTLFRALDTTKSCLLTQSDFVKFLDLMGESSSDHERKVRISELMKSNDDVDLDEFLDMVYNYSQHEEGKLGELANRVFVYSIKQECMNKGDAAESMKLCFV